jgi:methanogenic corrinoid protein MtbC1
VNDRTSAVWLTQAAIEDGVAPQTVVYADDRSDGRHRRSLPAKRDLVPEMLIAAGAMKESTAVLEPLLAGADTRPEATAVIGTVKGDLHDIGKNLVGEMESAEPKGNLAASIEADHRFHGRPYRTSGRERLVHDISELAPIPIT